MKANLLFDQRIDYDDGAIVEMVLWRVPSRAAQQGRARRSAGRSAGVSPAALRQARAVSEVEPWAWASLRDAQGRLSPRHETRTRRNPVGCGARSRLGAEFCLGTLLQ